MEDDRQRKRDSARKHTEYSVYSKKAVRIKENMLCVRLNSIEVEKSSTKK
jgi:hypothetical protein